VTYARRVLLVANRFVSSSAYRTLHLTCTRALCTDTNADARIVRAHARIYRAGGAAAIGLFKPLCVRNLCSRCFTQRTRRTPYSRYMTLQTEDPPITIINVTLHAIHVRPLLSLSFVTNSRFSIPILRDTTLPSFMACYFILICHSHLKCTLWGENLS